MLEITSSADGGAAAAAAAAAASFSQAFNSSKYLQQTSSTIIEYQAIELYDWCSS